MILTIVFILVLLIGISLFIAVVGTAFLRRNSRYVGNNRRYGPVRVEYPGPPRGVYEHRTTERAERREEPAPSHAPSYTPIEPRIFPAPQGRYPGGEGRYFLVTIVVLVVIFFGVFFGVRYYQSATTKPRLFFCENADLTRMRPVNASDTFTRGIVTLFLRSRAPLETDLVRVEVYRRDLEGIVPYFNKEMPLKPDWASFALMVAFDKIGTYTVMLYDRVGNLIAQNTIYIVPDSFAYKPIRG